MHTIACLASTAEHTTHTAACPCPQAKAAALAFNTMVDRVAADEEYLQGVLAAAAQEDEFTVGACCCGRSWKDARVPATRPAGRRLGPNQARSLIRDTLPPQARLLQVFRETADVRHARQGEEAVLAVLRSDYMLHAPTNSLLQVG